MRTLIVAVALVVLAQASPAAAATNSIFTVAADGKRGYSGEDGPATLAPLHLPHGVAALSDGGFLISDGLNRRIRKVAPSGIITTVSGNARPAGGPATAAQLSGGGDISVTADGGLPVRRHVEQPNPPDRAGRRDHNRGRNRGRRLLAVVRSSLWRSTSSARRCRRSARAAGPRCVASAPRLAPDAARSATRA